MSAYSEQQTQFREAVLLVAALKAMGITVIEHETAQTFSQWTGEPAEIVIPGKWATKNGNPGDYAAGFRKTANGTYGALISVEDSQDIYNAAWMDKVKQGYAEKGLMRQAERSGLRLIGAPVTGKDGVRRLQYQQM